MNYTIKYFVVGKYAVDSCLALVDASIILYRYVYYSLVKIVHYRGISIAYYGYEVVLSPKLTELNSGCEDTLPFSYLPFLSGMITTK